MLFRLGKVPGCMPGLHMLLQLRSGHLIDAAAERTASAARDIVKVVAEFSPTQ